jgi:hypothetical protein
MTTCCILLHILYTTRIIIDGSITFIMFCIYYDGAHHTVLVVARQPSNYNNMYSTTSIVAIMLAVYTAYRRTPDINTLRYYLNSSSVV